MNEIGSNNTSVKGWVYEKESLGGKGQFISTIIRIQRHWIPKETNQANDSITHTTTRRCLQEMIIQKEDPRLTVSTSTALLKWVFLPFISM